MEVHGPKDPVVGGVLRAHLRNDADRRPNASCPHTTLLSFSKYDKRVYALFCFNGKKSID